MYVSRKLILGALSWLADLTPASDDSAWLNRRFTGSSPWPWESDRAMGTSDWSPAVGAMLFCTFVGIGGLAKRCTTCQEKRRSKAAASPVPSDATNSSARSSLETRGFADLLGKQTRRHICIPEQKSLSNAHASPLFPSGSHSHVPPLRDVTRSQSNPSSSPACPPCKWRYPLRQVATSPDPFGPCACPRTLVCRHRPEKWMLQRLCCEYDLIGDDVSCRPHALCLI